MLTRFAVWLLCFCLVLGCSVNPVTNRRQVVLTSKATEKELGEREAAKIEAAFGLVEDEDLVAYVGAIGARLVAETGVSDYDFRFFVLDMQQPNALALPGGRIYVSRGLLALANSEDELAGVIGHEIAHVVGRDSGSRLTLGAPLSIATGIGARATSIVSPALGNLVGGIGGLTQGVLLSPYDRHQERNADSYGVGLAARAGWKPEAMASFLTTLQRYEELRGEQAGVLSFLSTHPTTPERVRNTAREAQVNAAADSPAIAAGKAGFLAKLDGLIVGASPRGGDFIEQTFVHPGMGFAIDFPEGWKTQNAADSVAALAPDEDAFVSLSLAGRGARPEEVAAAIASAKGMDFGRVERLQVNGLPAARTGVVRHRSGREVSAFQATWIEHEEDVYQVLFVSSPKSVDSYRAEREAASESFRAVTDGDLRRLEVVRLRVHRARKGESLEDLLERVDSSWSPEIAAVANGVSLSTALPEGTLIKAAVREAFKK